MLKVLIADDEPVIRAGLAQLIDWEQYGFTIAAKAKNGEQALRFILEDNPDLIITDIRMPKMDGLQLIKTLREDRQLQTPVIILTGFHEFDYARQAIRFEVKDYLLKPVDKAELIAALQRIRAGLVSERTLPVQHVYGNLIHLLLQGTAPNERKVDMCLKLEVRYPALLMVITLHSHPHLSSEQIHRLLQPVWESYRLADASVRTFLDVDGRVVLVIGPESARLSQSQEQQLAAAILHQVRHSLDQHVSLYMGVRAQSPEQLAQCFQEACSAYVYALYMNQPAVLNGDTLKLLPPLKEQAEYPASFQQLKEALETHNLPETEKTVAAIFGCFREQFISPAIIKMHLYRFLLDMDAIVLNMGGDTARIMKAAHEIDRSCTTTPLRLLEISYLDTCRQISASIAALRVQQDSGIIGQIEHYLISHFHENITLKEVAAKHYMNHAYLGQLFSKKKGLHFNEYLHHLRMEEAKRLIRRTDLKISEIAKKVGYNDPNYFSAKFEKHIGVTPSAYKAGLQQQSTASQEG